MVCLSVTVVSPGKTTKPIEIAFGLWARMGSRNRVLDRVQIPLWEGAIFGERGSPL